MAAAQAHLAQMKLIGVGLCGPRVDVDRRNCQRVVPMEVLCLGMPRTGTASMRMALLQLGFADVYHMTELWEENPKDNALWVEAYQAKFEGKGKEWGRKEWDALLGHCMALTDLPAISFAPELITAYPSAKIILTVRDTADAWHASMTHTIWTGHYILGPATSFLQAVVQTLVPRPECWPTLQYMYRYSVGEDFVERGRERYGEHNRAVRELALGKGGGDGERFLEFNVKQGWGPLCAFLGVEVPEGPFPRVNDSESWQAHVGAAKMKALVSVLKTLAGVGVLVMGVYLGLKGWGQ